MTRIKINILGLCEAKWTVEEAYYYSDEFRVIQSGGEERQRGVALILDKNTAGTTVEVHYKGDRLV